MTTAAPPVDTRSAGEIAAQVRTLLARYAPSYTGAGTDPITGQLVPDPRGGALIGVFTRFAELIIERLNRVPDKEFPRVPRSDRARRGCRRSRRASADLLALRKAARRGRRAARHPGRSAAGRRRKGSDHLRDRARAVVTPAALTAVSRAIQGPTPTRTSVRCQAARPLGGAPFSRRAADRSHRLLRPAAALGFNGITAFKVAIALDASMSEPRTVAWEAWDGTAFKEIFSRVEDSTDNLRTSGLVNLGPREPVPLSTVDGIESRWLRCRLAIPIDNSNGGLARDHMVRASDLPRVQFVTTEVDVNRDDLPIDHAFTNASPIDVTKDFFPFGETPRFGDTFFLRADEPFSTAGATVTIHRLHECRGSLEQPGRVATTDVRLHWEI
jgi:hypothetical protein